MGVVSYRGVDYSNKGPRIQNISEADYAALEQAGTIDPNTVYFRYELEDFGFNVQDDGTATTLLGGKVPTGRTIESYIHDAIHPIGTVIYSTTCDTMAKVVAAYGGTTWIQHAGYVLRGANVGVTANTAIKTGGEDTVTLTIAQMPSHSHEEYYTWNTAGNIGGNWKTQMVNTAYGGSGSWTHNSGLTDVSLTGGGQAHNNMQSYKDVYIWERTA